MNLNHFEKIESYLPVSLLTPGTALLAFAVVLFFVVFRYFLMVGPFVAVFYGLRPNWTRRRQIYPELPDKRQRRTELKWSLATSLIFALAGLLIGVLWELGLTRIYLRFDEYPYVWLPVSWLLLLALHDTYFYWTHRWLHRPGIYERYHKVHHRSLKPSPWASFSFHPGESVVNALAIPLILLVLPLHPVVVLWHLTFMTISAITNHLGFEVLPAAAVRHGYGKAVISGTHHTLHHKYFRCNYGLFFTFWDHVMKTERAGFAAEYAKVFDGKTPNPRS